jgi:hypothetical protein
MTRHVRDEGIAMRAHVGDRLLVGHDDHRVGLVVDVPRPDGQPPYIIKWLNDGHIAMVFPDQYARVIPASHPAGSALMPGEMA